MNLLDALDIQLHAVENIEECMHNPELFSQSKLKCYERSPFARMTPSRWDTSIELDFRHIFTVIAMEGDSPDTDGCHDTVLFGRETTFCDLIWESYFTPDDRIYGIRPFFGGYFFLPSFLRL